MLAINLTGTKAIVAYVVAIVVVLALVVWYTARNRAGR